MNGGDDTHRGDDAPAASALAAFRLRPLRLSRLLPGALLRQHPLEIGDVGGGLLGRQVGAGEVLGFLVAALQSDHQRQVLALARLGVGPCHRAAKNDLGLSYALNKELKRAETILRRAVAQPGAEPKVRQNLALVVGLQGRFQEAEKIAGGDLSPAEAQANVAYLRQMLAEQQQWKKNQRGSPLSPSTGS